MSDVTVPSRCFKGRPASPGLVEGRIVPYEAAGVRVRAAGGPATWGDFDRAVAATEAQLKALRDTAPTPQAADILDFQVEVLADPGLGESLAAARSAGRPAADAWTSALGEEIARLRSASDSYIRERASDLEDLRDRLSRLLSGTEAEAQVLPENAIVLARDLAPSRFLEIPWGPGHGLALMEGSPTAHVAVLARARGLAVAVGLGAVTAPADAIGLLDGTGGELILDPSPDDRRRAEERNATAPLAILEPRPTRAQTRDGTAVELLLNVNEFADLDALGRHQADGIGLTRTEFLFARHGLAEGRFPDEAVQLEAYRRILAAAQGRRVVIRTFDAGGDKPIAGYSDAGGLNPFLGLRGIRLSLARPGPFRVQLRALLRAAADGPLDVMLPMVSVPGELAAARRVLAEEAEALDRAGTPRGQPRLGMMVEVPAAALTLGSFPADFASIGSNDLIQYTMAAARDDAAVAGLADIVQPAVLALIDAAVAAATRAGMPISLCGDAAGDPTRVPLLLEHGLRSLSMPASALGAVAEAVAAADLGAAR